MRQGVLLVQREQREEHRGWDRLEALPVARAYRISQSQGFIHMLVTIGIVEDMSV